MKKASRGPQPAHSRAQLAAAAVKIADAEGLEAASMRRVAGEIGTVATSLYRYVRSKEELLDLMVDHVMGEKRVPQPTGDWRADLARIAHHTRAVLKRHPWMIAISGRSALGPNSLATSEASLAALDGWLLDADEMLIIITALASFTRGHTAEEIAEQQAEERSGLDSAQWLATQEEYGVTIRDSSSYPRIARIIVEAKGPHDPEQAQHAFDEGLACLLDGIAVRLARRPK